MSSIEISLAIASKNPRRISEFYVSMYSLAAEIDSKKNIKDNLFAIADESRKILPDTSYSSKMYDYVLSQYIEGKTWEEARDNIYQRYQVKGLDGYGITSKNLYCNGCFAAGINFAASLVSLFWGEGDVQKTIKIGTLSGWDSENPTSTWGGLLGFILGKDGVEKVFDRVFSNQYFIHRTRQNFDDDIDAFDNMSKKGLNIITRLVERELGGKYDLENHLWYIPKR